MSSSKIKIKATALFDNNSTILEILFQSGDIYFFGGRRCQWLGDLGFHSVCKQSEEVDSRSGV